MKFKFGNTKTLISYLKSSYPFVLDFPILILTISYLILGSRDDALVHGVGAGILVIASAWSAYRKNEIHNKRLLLSKYRKYPIFKYLWENDFKLNKDLYFEGKYQQYEFVIFIISKFEDGIENNYIVIRSFYNLPITYSNNKKKERDLCGKYYFGELFFENNSVTFVPYDWKRPNFEENFNALISIYQRENLTPLSKNEWLSKIDK